MTVGADASSQPLPPNAEPKPNPWQRITGVFFSPGETFASIARRPDMTVPLVLIILATILISIVIFLRVDYTAGVADNMPPNATAQQIEAGTKMAAMFGKIFTFAAPFFAVLGITIVAAILLLAFRLMGGEGTFQQAFSVVTYASMPSVVKSIITAIIVLLRPGLGIQELETVVRSGPAFLVEQKVHPVLFSFLGSLDLFTIWFVVLLIIGFAAVSQFSRAKSAAIILTLWAIAIVVKLGFVSLGVMMRNKAAAGS
jgi:hypothetical protein